MKALVVAAIVANALGERVVALALVSITLGAEMVITAAGRLADGGCCCCCARAGIAQAKEATSRAAAATHRMGALGFGGEDSDGGGTGCARTGAEALRLLVREPHSAGNATGFAGEFKTNLMARPALLLRETTAASRRHGNDGTCVWLMFILSECRGSGDHPEEDRAGMCSN